MTPNLHGLEGTPLGDEIIKNLKEEEYRNKKTEKELPEGATGWTPNGEPVYPPEKDVYSDIGYRR